MKQILIFATWWRHFSGQSIKIAFSTTNIAPSGGRIFFCFIEASLVVFQKVLRGAKNNAHKNKVDEPLIFMAHPYMQPPVRSNLCKEM